jgi:NAD(P)H dehydrogenase (quinone)
MSSNQSNNKVNRKLIIYAHPDHDSHSRYTLEQVKERLNEKNETYEVLDLYAMKFNPVLSYEELYQSEKYHPEKHGHEHTVQHESDAHKHHSDKILDEVKRLQEKISHSNELIFIYPIWWNGMPAILKGFIDRVFNSGFAYKYVNGMPAGLLKGKIAKVFVSSGAKKWMTMMFLGNRFKKNAETDILGFCGIKTKVYHVDGAYTLNDKQREKIRKNVSKALS